MDGNWQLDQKRGWIDPCGRKYTSGQLPQYYPRVKKLLRVVSIERCGPESGDLVVRTAGPPVGRGQDLPEGPVLFPGAEPSGEGSIAGVPPGSAHMTEGDGIYCAEITLV